VRDNLHGTIRNYTISYKNAIVNKFTSVYSMICWIFMQKIATNKLKLIIFKIFKLETANAKLRSQDSTIYLLA